MILFVEDDDTLRMGAVSALETLGYSVLAAPNGEAALELYRVHRADIDVIVSDVLMPKMDGRGLYDAVRQYDTTVRFVFSTGQGVRAAEVLGVLGSEVPLLAKPWTLGALTRAIGRAVNTASC